MRSCPGSSDDGARAPRRPPRARGPFQPRLHALSQAACLALALAAAPAGWALPQGAVLTAGSASVRADGARQLEIVQATPRAALDWTSFSIAAGERVRIRQPDAAAVLFNRVTGADPSLILGQLQADGRVFLSNPRGVIFGAGSRVDVGGLVATTLNADTTALALGQAGRWQLSGGTAATGELRADGEIHAPAGTVALVGPRISIGGNVLAGRLGAAAVGAVQVDVDGDGLIFFNARSEDLATRLDLLGSAQALAGSAELRAAARAGFADTVLNLAGTVRASGLAQRDGQVVIDGGRAGLTRVAGVVTASADAAGTRGGAITVLGEQLQLDAGARLQASGSAAGGVVRVGGDFQGSNADALPPARSVAVQAGAVLAADATVQGDGGRVILWSSERTQFAGHASVRGGEAGGNGGLVEVSSRGALRFAGMADRRAPLGQAGELLLDPTTLTVQEASGSGDDILTVTSLLAQLAAGAVTLQADDRITVNAAVNSPSVNGAGSLTLKVNGNDAADSIAINQPISLAGAGRTLTLEARSIGIGDVDLAAAGLVLKGATSWTNAAARTVALPISGAGSLTKLGAGVLTLSGSNSHSGGTTVAGGTLRLGAAGALPASQAVTVSGGATLDLNGNSPSVGVFALTDGSLVDSGNAAGALTATQFALAKGTVSAVLAGAAATLSKTGGDTVTLSGANTFGGGSTVAAGMLVAGVSSVAAGPGVAASGAFGTGAVGVASGASVDLAGFVVNNAWQLAGSGVGDLGALRSSSGTAGASSGAVTLAGDATLGVADGAALRLSGVVAESGGTPRTLSKAGEGTLTLAGASTYSGGSTVTAGTLVAGVSSVAAGPGVAASGAFGTGAVEVAPGASVDLAGFVVNNAWQLAGSGVGGLGALRSSSGTAGASSGAVTLAGDATLGVADGAALRLSGVVAESGGTPRALSKAGEGTLTLAGASTYSGGSTVTAGMLVAGVSSVAAAPGVAASGAFGTGAVVVTSGASVDLAGFVVNNAWQLAGSGVGDLGALRSSSGVAGASSGAVTLSADATLGVDAATSTLTLSGTLSGTGRLDKLGAGRLVLAGDAAPGGGTAVAQGILQIGSGGTSGSLAGDIDLAAGSTLQVQRSNALVVSGRISGAGVLHQAGIGALTLSGASTYTGGSTVSAGSLVAGVDAVAAAPGVAASGAFGTGPVTVADGASVDLAGRVVNNAWSLAGSGPGGLGVLRSSTGTAGASSGSITLAADATLGVDGGAALALSGDIADGGGVARGLTKAGSGTLTLTGTATHGGGTTISAGSLRIGDGGSRGALGGDVLNHGRLVFERDDEIVFGRTVSGTGVLEQAGTGTLVLTTNQGHTGGTVVSAGTLQLGNGGGAGSVGSTVTVLQDAQLVFRRAGDLAFDGLISGAGGVTQAGSGTLSFSADQAYTGLTTIASGSSLRLGVGADAGSVRGDIANQGTLSVLRSNELHLTGSMSGSGALLLTGGQLRLSGERTATGSTTLEAGTRLTLHRDADLRWAGTLGGAGSVDKSGSGTLTVVGDWAPGAGTQVSGGTLRIGEGAGSGSLAGGDISLQTGTALVFQRSGTVTLDSNVSGSGRFEQAGPGTLVLTGTVAVDGGNRISAGVLQVGNGGTRGWLQGAVSNSGELAFARSDDIVLTSLIGGSGQLRQAGDGSLTLAGANTYSGGTTVSRGTLVAGRASSGVAGALTAGPLGTGTVAVAAGAAVDLAGLQVDNAWRLSGGTALRSSSGSAASAGALTLAADSTVAVGGTALRLSGALGGSGALTLQGPGTLVLAGANTATGGTTVASGTLQLDGGSNRAGSGPLQVAAGAVLDLHDGAQLTVPMTLSGTLRVATGEPAATASGALTLGGNATLQVDGAGLTLSGNVADSGGARTLSKTGAGTLTLSGINRSAGGIALQAGTLVAAGGQALGDAGTLQMAADSTLRLQDNETVGALAGAGTVQLDRFTLSAGGSGANTSFAGQLQGSGGLSKQGGGTLTLSGANLYTGATEVQAGTLVLGAGATAGVLSALSVAAGAQLTLQSDQVFGALAGEGTVALGSAALTAGGNDRSTRFDGVISGSGSFTKAGGGTLTLGGASTYSGGTAVADGTLVAAAGSAGAAGALSAGPMGTGRVSVAAGAAVDLAGQQVDNAWRLGGGTALGSSSGSAASAGALTLAADSTLTVAGTQLSLSGAIDGTGRLTLQGPGTLVLSGTNTASGGATVASGTLQLAGGTDRTGSGAVQVDSAGTLDLRSGARLSVPLQLAGTLANSAGSATVSGPLTLTGDATVRVEGTGLALSGNLADAGGPRTLSKAGTGTLTLSGVNSSAGDLLLQAGTLVAANGQALGDAGTLQMTDGATLRLQASETVGALAGAGTVQLAGFTLSAGGNGANSRYAGRLLGDGGLTKQGGGTLTLAGINSYTGATTVQAGTLALASGGALSLDSGVALAAGTQLLLQAEQALGTLSGTGEVQLGSFALSLGGDGSSSQFDGRIRGSGALSKAGAGTLTLAGANTYSGGTTVSRGTLVAGRASSGVAGALTAGPLGTGTVAVAEGAAVDLAGLQVDNAWRLSGGTALRSSSGSAASAGALTLAADSTVGVGGTALRLSGALGGSGALTLQGPGTLVLAGANTATGGTTVASGTLQLDGGSNRAGSGPLQVAAGAVLDLHDGAQLTVPMTLSGTLRVATGEPAATASGALTLGGNATLQVDGAGLTLSGNVADSGGARTLSKTGAGTLTLSGINRSAGGIALQAGTLVAAGGQALGDAGTLQMAADSTLRLQDNETVGALAGAGTVQLDRFTLSAGGSGANASFAGQLQGSGGLSKQGGGTLTLSGVNLYTGATEVQAGTLVLGAGATAGVLSALSVAAGAQLTLQSDQVFGALAGEGTVALGSAALTAGGNDRSTRFDGVISGSGSFTKAGGGTLTLGGASTYSGGTAVADGTLVAAAGSAGAAGALSAGPMGTGRVSVAAGAAVDLAGQQVDNAWRLGGGTALGSSSGSAASAGALTLAADSTLTVAGTQLSLSGAIDGTGRLTLQGPGTLVLSGTNTASGGATVASGTLQLAGGTDRTGSGAVQVDSAGTLDLRSGARLSVPLQLAGTLANSAGSATVSGPLTLTGDATVRVEGTGLALSGNLADAGGPRTLSKAGTGTLTLSGVNSSAGDLLLQAGTLVAANGQALGDAGTLQMTDGATLRLQASETVGALAGAGTVQLAGFTLSAGGNGANSRYAGRLLGDGGLTKQGGGTLTLAGINSYTGATTVQAGTLALGPEGTAGAGSAVTLVDGARLTMQSDQVLGSLAGAGEVAQDSFALSTGGDGSSTRFDGVLSGSGSLTKTGAGTFTLAGRDERSGATTVAQGTLALASSAAAASASTYRVEDASTLAVQADVTVAALAGTGTVDLAPGSLRVLTPAGASSSFAGILQGSGGLVKQGGGTLTLSGANAYTGRSAVLGGTLVVQGDAQLGRAPAALVADQLLLDGGTLQILADTTLAATRGLTLQGAGGTLLLPAGVQVDVAGPLADGLDAGSLTLRGGGTLAFNGVVDNRHSGGTRVLGSTLSLARDGQLGADAGELLLDGGTLLLRDSLRLGAARTLALGAAGGTLQLGSGLALQIASRIADATGAFAAQDGLLRLQGGGSFSLDGSAANTYTGATAVQGSTLLFARDDQLGAAPASARANQLQLDGATLALQPGADPARVTLHAHRGLALGAGGGTLQVAEGAALSLAGSVSDAAPGVAGVLTKAGGGLLQLAGDQPNSHRGGTVVQAGTLALARDELLGAADAALQLDGGSLLAQDSFALDVRRPLQLGAAGGRIDVAAGHTLRVAGRVDELAGAATLTKTGAGTLAFDGDTDHARLGPTQVLAGTLAITRDGQLGRAPALAAADQLLLDGATLRLDADLTLAATRGIALGAGGGTLAVADGVAVRMDGAFSDAGPAAATLRKAGAGSLTLAGDNRHGGGTDVQAGALATAGDQRLPDAGALQLAVGTRFTLGGAETLGALADLPGVGAGLPAQLVLDRHVLTVRQGIDTQFSGRIDTGSGQLVKEGSGTLAMAGQGSGNGLFQVNSGVLVSASADLLTADTTVQVADRATLRLDTAVSVQSLRLSGELSGSGSMRVSGASTIDGGTLRTPLATATLASRQQVQVLAPLSVAGAAVVEGGTLTLGTGGLLQAAQLQLGGGASLVTVAAGQLGSGAALALAGGSLLQLAGAESAASLAVGGGSRVAGNGSLALSGALALADGTLALPTQAAQFSSRGDSTLTAALTLGESATLQGGTLSLGAGGVIDSPLLRLEAGLLRSTEAQALGRGATALRIDAPATLQLGAPATVATLSLAGSVMSVPAAGASAVDAPGMSAMAAVALAADAGDAAGTLAATQSVTLDGGLVSSPLATRTLLTQGLATLAAAVQASEQTTVTGTLTLAAGGSLATPVLQLASGTLGTTGSAQLLALPLLQMAAGTTLTLAGSETLGALVDAAGAAAGAAAQVRLADAAGSTLQVGAAVADAATVQRFSGVFSGAGTLAKQGAGTWVLSADQAHGDTRIEAGTLQLGEGGRSGSLGRGALHNDGLLRVLRSDTLALDNLISGSGALEQAGSGQLLLGATGNRYTGATRVLAGSLATAGDERLPDASAVQVAAGASLQLRGSETVAALAAEGPVTLGGALATTTGGQRFGGPVTVAAATPVTLSAPGQTIEALHDDNQWTLMPLSVHAAQLRLSAGRGADGVWRDLVLGEVRLGSAPATPAAVGADRQASAAALADGATAGDSLIEARRVQIGQSAAATGDARLDGLLQLDGGTLTLRANGTPGYSLLAPLESGRQAVDPLQGRLLQVADDVIVQGAASRVSTAAGAGLVLQASAGGSITLGNADNRFAGSVQALSGTDWNSGWAPVSLAGERAVGQSRITLAGQEIVVGGQGLEADLLRLSAGRLATVDDSRLAARLWYNDSGFGIQNSAPGLVLELLPQAFASALAFGSADAPINANVGGKSLGARSDGLAAGYVQLLPRDAAPGSTVVFLAGPSATQAGESGYSFFNDGAGDQSRLPLFYNGVLPATPQLSGSLSAVASVSENARRERFEETVRTENVAIRLRAGVIAEVGPGRPATGGAAGLRLPSSCSAEVGRLACPPAAAPTGAQAGAPAAIGQGGAAP